MTTSAFLVSCDSCACSEPVQRPPGLNERLARIEENSALRDDVAEYGATQWRNRELEPFKFAGSLHRPDSPDRGNGREALAELGIVLSQCCCPDRRGRQRRPRISMTAEVGAPNDNRKRHGSRAITGQPCPSDCCKGVSAGTVPAVAVMHDRLCTGGEGRIPSGSPALRKRRRRLVEARFGPRNTREYIKVLCLPGDIPARVEKGPAPADQRRRKRIVYRD